jgi:response regulator RpfG family c-di-GMP phosphodiesterase
MNAVELIGELKKSKEYLHIPIVVLSGVVTPLSVKDCYAAGATSFIKKPASVVETNNKISAFIKYWFETVELPK